MKDNIDRRPTSFGHATDYTSLVLFVSAFVTTLTHSIPQAQMAAADAAASGSQSVLTTAFSVHDL